MDDTITAVPASAMLRDVLHGLQPDVRKLSPKYFYDEVGAGLFDDITRLEAYYPTRTELGIMNRHVGEMADAIGPAARIIEFGSGSGLKTRLLLEHVHQPAAYTPIDISCVQLDEFAASVAGELPALEVLPLCADYMQPLTLPQPQTAPATTVAFFPGSTIGNFEPVEAARFLERIRRLCAPNGSLLLGTDMHKDTAVLERAYNDPEGVTAAFNLNMLEHINRATGADFNVSQWRHHAFYDLEMQRIEMRLVCKADCTVTVPASQDTDAATFQFSAGDHITTEYSHKFTPAAVAELAASTGWRIDRQWTDDAGWFSIWLLRVAE
jgi:dimethylhistidine N-methyltransferase